MLLLVQERFKVLVLNVIDLWLRTLLAHHSVIHFQQKRCPHGVAVFSCSFSKHSAHFIPLLVLMLVAAGLSCETRRSNGLPDFRCCSETDNSSPQVTCRQSDERKITIHPRVKIPCDTKNSYSNILNPLTPQSD